MQTSEFDGERMRSSDSLRRLKRLRMKLSGCKGASDYRKASADARATYESGYSWAVARKQCLRVQRTIEESA